MAPLIRAELRKLFTVRSTYVLAGLSILIAGALSYWALGYKALPFSDSIFMDAAVTGATSVVIFIAITGVLQVAHEYRYNTIMYTLTSSNSRSKTLFAKVLVNSLYAVIFTLFIMAFSALCSWIGVQVKGDTITPQHFYYWSSTWHTVFLNWGYMMVGLLVAVLVRHVVGAIVVLLVVPSTIEGLLTIFLKENGKYLPFTALEQVQSHSVLSPIKGAGIFMIYLVVGWAITWILFLRRDAN